MDDKKLLNGKFTFKSCVVQKKRASLLSENVNRQLAESKEVVGLPFIGNLTVMVHCFRNKRPDCYVPSKLEKKKILGHGFGVLVYLKCALYNFILYRPVRSEERRVG